MKPKVLKASNIMILFAFFFSTPLLAQTKQKKPTTLFSYQTLSTAQHKEPVERWEWRYHLKGHLNPLQTIPIYNTDQFKLDFGPAQFQLTIPFR